MLAIQCPQDRPAVRAWLAAALPELPGGSLHVLDALSSAVNRSFIYKRREAEGVQSPTETIAFGSGSCRDFALLFMEAARSLGFAARFVTGYLYDPGADVLPRVAMSGGGATHAWADVFLPGAGWIEFDPTNRIVASRNLVRVATTRSPGQALPISGSFRRADGGMLLGMDVEVSVVRSE